MFGLSWWCVLNCVFLLMSKSSAGSSALNICDVKVDLYLSSSSLLSLDGLYCNNCHSQQEVQVASLGGLWPKLLPGSSQQPSPAMAGKKIDSTIYSQCFLGRAKSAEGWYQSLAGRVKHQCLSQVTSLQAARRLCLQANLPQVQQERQRVVCLGLGATTSTLLTMTKQLRHDCSAIRIMNWPGTVGEATRIFKLVWVTANC